MVERTPLKNSEIEELRETLKRCPEGTLEALVSYRNDCNKAELSFFLEGVIKRFLDPEYACLLDGDKSQLRFIEDLGVDSMTMMEFVMVVEECLDIQIDNTDLMNIRTYGDLNSYVTDLAVN